MTTAIIFLLGLFLTALVAGVFVMATNGLRQIDEAGTPSEPAAATLITSGD